MFSTRHSNSYGYYAPRVAVLINYSYEDDFKQIFPMKNRTMNALSFNFIFCHKDDVHSLNNSRFGDFVERIYSVKLENDDTTDSFKGISYLYLHIKIVYKGQLRTKAYAAM